jgi:hypothetical protein
MSQRDSGYARVAFDQYETPEWATRALIPHIPKRVKQVWEPACGSGKMVRALKGNGFRVDGSDIQDDVDFFTIGVDGFGRHDSGIITNPPYAGATAFVEHALKLTHDDKGFVAMLLRTDFDHAKSRRHLFADHPAFAKKLVLTKRIQWFEDSKSSPSFNHAWFIWDWQHQGAPTIAYHFED